MEVVVSCVYGLAVTAGSQCISLEHGSRDTQLPPTAIEVRLICDNVSRASYVGSENLESVL